MRPVHIFSVIASAVAIGGLLVVSGCGGDDNGGPAGISVAQASTDRDEDPSVSQEDLAALVQGNAGFAADLYGVLREREGNLFFSPYSISVALAMTYAGASGNTATEMADALHFELPQDRLHAAFNRLDLEMEARSEVDTDDDADPFELSIANAIWAERTYTFQDAFLETLALHYGAGARLVDFRGDPEPAREAINDWVSGETNDRIPELIPPNVITNLTRLVLTNAIYFKASWDEPFLEELTEDGEFTLLSGDTVTASMMRSGMTRNLPYAETVGLQAIELPYTGGEVAMLLLLPEEGRFAEVEAALDGEMLRQLVASMTPQAVSVLMPKFEFSSDVPLKAVLSPMMPSAFDPDAADFSGMDGTRDLFIQDVLHKAFVAVDEEGTEAAAATAVVVGVTSAPADPKTFEADRPFIFLIRDRVTGAVLFLGRVVDPTAE